MAARRTLALLVAGTTFMELLDGTIIATAAPDMAVSLGVRPADIGVAITAYLVTVAVGTPASGWIAERFGTRRVFLLAIAMFSVSSLACAMAPTLSILVTARIAQGLGGALMVPVGRLVVLRATEPSELIRAIAFLTWPALAAPVVAPLLGGILTMYLSWHWIFLVNVPLGIAAAIIGMRVVPNHTADLPGLDWLGFTLSGIAVAALVLGSDAIGAAAPNWLVVVTGLVVAVVAGWATVRHLLRTQHPLIDLGVLKIATFRLAHTQGSIFRATTYAVPFVLPLMMQVGFGWSPVRAGAYVAAVFVGNLGIKPTTTALLRRFSFRAVICTATTLLAITMLGCAFLNADTAPVLIVALLVVSGAARSVGFTGYGTLGLADVDKPELRDANALSTTLQQLAGGLGVALAVLCIATASRVWSLGELPVYRATFVVLALLTIATVPLVWRIGPQAGHRLKS